MERGRRRRQIKARGGDGEREAQAADKAQAVDAERETQAADKGKRVGWREGNASGR